MRRILTVLLAGLLGSGLVTAAEQLHPPVTLADLQTTLKAQARARGQLRLRATGQTRPATNTAPLRKLAAEPAADPAVRALYSREGEFYEGGTLCWVLIPDQLFVHYRSDVAAGTLLRTQVLAVASLGEQALLLLEGYEVTGQAAVAPAPKHSISGSSNK